MSELDEIVFWGEDPNWDFDRPAREPVKLEGWIKRTTEKAVLCGIGEREVWIPRSILGPGTDVQRVGDDGTIVVPHWFAEQEDLTDE